MEPLPGQLGFDFDELVPADVCVQTPVDDLLLGDCARNQEMPATLSVGYWRGFTADHPVADAVARFRQRFGHDPEQVRQDRGILLVGPL
jgi:hypothetical protein